ncbi:monovalent cation/H+ antiporter complex subunit F [Brevibacterium samyangense]|uniref:PASTA domain-containing protein n=1 Tax=Brevibacterium samyangense TaxID=366888 RepID=A0ABN2TB22_9MICO
MSDLTTLIDPAIARIAVPVLAVLFAASAVLAVVKIVRGPSILDRMIGSDVLLATLMCGMGAFMAFTGRSDLLVIVLVLSSMGFIGSVSVSRYVSRGEARGGAVLGAPSRHARGATGSGERGASAGGDSAGGSAAGAGSAEGASGRSDIDWVRDTMAVAGTPSTEQVPEVAGTMTADDVLAIVRRAGGQEEEGTADDPTDPTEPGEETR